MRKKGKKQENVRFSDPVVLKPFEVTIQEAGGSTDRLIRKFLKKVRKHEVLKPFYGKLSYYSTKSQLRRERKYKAIFKQKKALKEQEAEENQELEK